MLPRVEPVTAPGVAARALARRRESARSEALGEAAPRLRGGAEIDGPACVPGGRAASRIHWPSVTVTRDARAPLVAVLFIYSFVVLLGQPIVLGFHAAGDTHLHQPALRAGLLAGDGAGRLLADELAAHPDDPVARSIAYEQATDSEVLPWYKASVNQDRLNRAKSAQPRRNRPLATIRTCRPTA